MVMACGIFSIYCYLFNFYRQSYLEWVCCS